MAVAIDRTAGPLDLDGYQGATLTVVWAYSSSAERIYLLLAWVEFTPTEVPPDPTRLFQGSGGSLGGNTPTVWAGTASMSANDALDWYLDALQGSWSVPASLGKLASAKEPPPCEPLGPALAEPDWPTLAVLKDHPAALPFIRRTHASPRVHHRLAMSWSEAEWTRPTVERVADAAGGLLGFPLDPTSALWGSVHLVMPNPVLRRVRTRVEPVSAGEDEHLAVELVLRDGATLDGLSVDVWEERALSRSVLSRFRPTQPVTTVKLSGKRGSVGVAVWSDSLGLIHEGRPAPFVHQVELDTYLGLGERDVDAGTRRGKPVQYRSRMRRLASSRSVGSAREARAQAQLRAEVRRLAIADAQASGKEAWFESDWHAAQATLRRLIGRTHSHVMLVDYFLSANDCRLILPAIESLNSNVQLLTSQEGLTLVAGKESTWEAEGARLRSAAATIAAQCSLQRVEVRYLPGKRSRVHDRFLVADDRVYLLGSSLNEYGQRATMLRELEFPEEAARRLTAHWGSSRELPESAATREGPMDAEEE